MSDLIRALEAQHALLETMVADAKDACDRADARWRNLLVQREGVRERIRAELRKPPPAGAPGETTP